MAVKRMAVVQGILVVVVLATCLLLPRPGSAVLLIPAGFSVSANWPGMGPGPIDSRTGDSRTGDSRTGEGGIAVLHAGALRGSVLVRVDGEVPVLALLRAGWLPIAAPRWLCDAPI